jgi:hypothetical protein
MVIEAPDPMDLKKPTWQYILPVASRGEGVNWALSPGDAQEMIKDLKIELTKGGGVPGELSAVFEYEEHTFTITHYLSKYEVFGGRWKPDPRFTGD